MRARGLRQRKSNNPQPHRRICSTRDLLSVDLALRQLAYPPCQQSEPHNRRDEDQSRTGLRELPLELHYCHHE